MEQSDKVEEDAQLQSRKAEEETEQSEKGGVEEMQQSEKGEEGDDPMEIAEEKPEPSASAPVEDPVKSSASAENTVNSTPPVENPVKSPASDENAVVSTPPVENPVRSSASAENAVISTPVENPVNSLAFAEIAGHFSPLENPVDSIAPIQNPVKIPPVQNPVKIPPVQNPVKSPGLEYLVEAMLREGSSSARSPQSAVAMDRQLKRSQDDRLDACRKVISYVNSLDFASLTDKEIRTLLMIREIGHAVVSGHRKLPTDSDVSRVLKDSTEQMVVACKKIVDQVSGMEFQDLNEPEKQTLTTVMQIARGIISKHGAQFEED